MLKDLLNEKVVSPAFRAGNTTLITVGKVISADEVNNKCTVTYKDSQGKVITVSDMMVDLRNHDQWFPNPNEVVLINATNTPGVVLHRYTENYAADIRGDKKLVNDISADSDSSLFGGSIL